MQKNEKKKETFLSLNGAISGYARLHPDRVAINYYGRQITYGELDDWTSRFAASLAGMGVKKGDRVSLYMENCPQYIIAMLGGWKYGAVMVPSNPMFLADELAYQLVDAGAKVIVLQEDVLPVFESVRGRTPVDKVIVARHHEFLPEQPALPLHYTLVNRIADAGGGVLFSQMLSRRGSLGEKEPGSDDLALLQYTEGITSQPKGAMITHGNLMFNTVSAFWYKGRPGDRHLAVLPLFEVTGLVHSMSMPLYTGGTIILLARYNTETVLRAIEKYRCTHWASVSTMNIAILNYPGVKKWDLTSLKACLSAGAPLAADIFHRFQSLTGASLVTGHGYIETISQVTVNPVNNPRLSSVGLPVQGTEVKIVDINNRNREVPGGQEGELLVKGPQVMKGYWNRPEETRAALHGGWFVTGEVVRADRDGYIYVIGRKKELIKASGFNVFPREVEHFLRRHPAVAEVAVVGMPDYYRVETVKAFIVLKREYEGKVREADIMEWSRRQMAAYKYPRQVEFVSELPYNGEGKVLRYCLKG